MEPEEPLIILWKWGGADERQGEQCAAQRRENQRLLAEENLIEQEKEKQKQM
jgi:hypothetical protein